MIYFVYLLMCSCIVFVCYQCCICKIFLYKCLESLNKLPFQKRSNSAICLFLESQNHIFSISRIEMIQRWTVFCFCCCCCCTSLSKEFQKGPLDGAWTVIPPPAPTRRPHLSTRLPKALLSVSAHLLLKFTRKLGSLLWVFSLPQILAW